MTTRTSSALLTATPRSCPPSHQGRAKEWPLRFFLYSFPPSFFPPSLSPPFFSSLPSLPSPSPPSSLKLKTNKQHSTQKPQLPPEARGYPQVQLALPARPGLVQPLGLTTVEQLSVWPAPRVFVDLGSKAVLDQENPLPGSPLQYPGPLSTLC